MINLETIKKVAEKSGVANELVEKALGAFEGEAGVNNILNMVGGAKGTLEKLVPVVSKKTGVSEADCKKIIDALQDILAGGMPDLGDLGNIASSFLGKKE